MINKFNYTFWRTRLFWLLAFTVWGYLNISAIVTQSATYSSVMHSIIGIILSFVAVPVVMSLFYFVLLILNVGLKVPFLISTNEVNGRYQNGSVTVIHDDINTSIPLSAIRTVALKPQFIAMTISTHSSLYILEKNILGEEVFNTITDELRRQVGNYSYEIITETHLWVWLTIMYVLTIWAYWSAFVV